MLKRIRQSHNLIVMNFTLLLVEWIYVLYVMHTKKNKIISQHSTQNLASCYVICIVFSNKTSQTLQLNLVSQLLLNFVNVKFLSTWSSRFSILTRFTCLFELLKYINKIQCDEKFFYLRYNRFWFLSFLVWIYAYYSLIFYFNCFIGHLKHVGANCLCGELHRLTLLCSFLFLCSSNN